MLLCSPQDISYSICFGQTFSKWSHKKQSENTGRYDFGLFVCLFFCLKCEMGYTRLMKPLSMIQYKCTHLWHIVFVVGDWKTEILEYIDKDNLPEYYGGKCRDPDGDPRCRSRVHIFMFSDICQLLHILWLLNFFTTWPLKI